MFSLFTKIFSTNESEFENLYGKLFEIHLKMKKSLVPACIKYDGEWQMKVINKEEIENVLNEWEKEFEQISPKIKRKTKKCIFFGETSCGKSSLINATLQSNDLPWGFGSISTCFVEIQAIPQNRQVEDSYLVVNGKKREIGLLSRLNNVQSDNPLRPGSHIDLFYNSVNCPMLRNDAVLIDTPGIDENIQTDAHVERYCNEADLIIVIVNSASSLNSTINGFIVRLKRYFPKSNLAIVYNFWDLPDDRDEREQTKMHFKRRAKEVLCDQLGYSDEEANERIHFLSAYERILVNRNDEKLQSIPRWQSRNDAFDRFNAFLQRQMEESAFERRYNYLLHLQTRLIPILHQCHSVVTEMSDKIEEQSKHIKDKFHDIKELEEEIKKSTASIFSLAYDKFIEGALEINENEKALTTKDEYKNLMNEVDENESLNDKLKNLLKDIVEKGKEDLKEKIKDCIGRTNDEFLAERTLIVEKIYFPLYLDEMTMEYCEYFIEILGKIGFKIKLSTGISIGLTAVVGAAVVGTGGVAAAILAPIEVAFLAMVGIGTGGAVAGGVSGGGIMYKIIKAFKTRFQFVWTNDVDPIRLLWKGLEGELCNSYERFLNGIDVDLQNGICSLKAELRKIQNDLDSVVNEIRQFYNIVSLS